jgi:hypothetical protein
LVAAEAGIAMAKRTSHQRKHINRLNSMARTGRLLSLKRKNERLIPAKILHKLASLNLPEANQFVYQACLEKLMREA